MVAPFMAPIAGFGTADFFEEILRRMAPFAEAMGQR